MSIVDLLARVTARCATSLAIEDVTHRLTYAELDARSNAIARRLEAIGIGPDQLVGICTRPSIETVVALIGVLKAGGAFVLLDISYPAPRLASMLADSALQLVLVDRACNDAPGLAGVERLVIGRDADPREGRPSRIDPDNLAYVVFTSGSTGRPKGVAVTHGGLTNLVERQIEAFRIDSSSRVFQFAPLGFDAVVSEVLTALGAGATLCLEARGAGHDIGELLVRRAITVVTMPPSLLRVLPPDGMPALRTVVSAGEACSADIVARWATERRLINAYGPSECTVCATLKEMAGPNDSPTIGRAMGGVETFVLDEALAPVPPGGTGELYLGGRALARGYLGLPGLTAERFVPDPFGGRGARMYRTGDVVRLLAGGELEYLGRTDDQVKVRGFRVEPREVEDALREMPAVDDVVVLARKRASGESVLVAYVMCRSGAVGEREVHELARARLPHFLRPSEIVLLAEWPLSPNGKIDRGALAQLRQNAGQSASARTTSEQRIERIACDLLERSAVDLDRSFFDQGGDSIAAARMAIAIGAAFDRQLPMGMLFECPSLRALATRIDEAIAKPASTDAREIIRLRSGNARPAIWMPAPVHGNALCYLRFASLLDGDVRCGGLQAPGVDGEATPIDDFVALAAHHVQTIRQHQPRGPYILAGWSMGGSLAFEMAVQLERAGAEVSHLVLIGSTPPSADHLDAARATMQRYETWRMAYFYLRSLAFSLGLPIALDFGEFSRLSDDQVFGRFVTQVRTLGPLGAEIDDALARRWLGVVRANLYGFHHHAPSGKFRGRALTIHPSGANPLLDDDLVRARPVPPGRWDEHLAGPVDTRFVAGNHYTLMQDPWVAELATVVDGWLRANAAFG